MEEAWIGKAVSIQCDEKLGVFQGTIKDISCEHITIVRAFRNGVPLRKQDAEVTLSATDIQSLELIPTYNVQSTVTPNLVNNPTPVKQPNFGAIAKESTSMLTNKMTNMRIGGPGGGGGGSTNGHRRSPPLDKSTSKQPPNTSSNSKSPANVTKFYGNLIPPKVEVRLGASFSNNTQDYANRNSSRPIDIQDGAKSAPINNSHLSNSNNFNGYNGNGNGNKGNRSNLNNNQRKKTRRDAILKHNQTFGTQIDDSMMNEDFDFEGNLALFDKRAVWNTIESMQRPDLVNQAVASNRKTFRHDENILATEPTELRQIDTVFQSSSDFVTDQGLIIPTIPMYVRTKIQQLCIKYGLSAERLNDTLGRGATDLALLLLGGARRLIPNNSHQWPTIVIVCDNLKAGEVGAATGRQLASHGLKVVLFFQDKDINTTENREIDLFRATKNAIVNSISDLPSPDLVILSINSTAVASHVKKWLTDNRLSILAMDPPPGGFDGVQIKCSILPILPLNNITINCGKLYLCNMGIPDKFYHDAGIIYKSPFGHKFVIQIHFKD